MLKYLSGLFTGVLLGGIAVAAIEGIMASEYPEAQKKYVDYIQSIKP